MNRTTRQRTGAGNRRDSAYFLARIARDHPAILARLKAGEFRSIRAAAIAAGILRVPTPDESDE